MFADPENNIKQFGLREGDTVADLGAGAGFYTLAAAGAVGKDGKVYAIDINLDLLKRVKEEAEGSGLQNVEIIHGDLEKKDGTKLADLSVDAVVASNILFQIKNKDVLVKEIYRILKPEGKALVIDWQDSFGGMGPGKLAIVPPQMTKNFSEIHGFGIEKEISAAEPH